MTRIEIDGTVYTSVTEARKALDKLITAANLANAERLPRFSTFTRRSLYCSWCNQIIADDVNELDTQQTEYEHVRTVHPLAEKFFFYVP